MDGRTGASGPAVLSCHCLLLELSDRLVLVDTGFGLADVRDRSRLHPFFRLMCGPRLRAEHTAIRQIEKLGFAASDVRDIVLTHLDFDHAGGLDDFPDARVHLLEKERVTARQRKTFIQRGRFRPQQWSTMDHWIGYEATGEPWFGFDAVRQLDGLPPELAIVPLFGHTLGHAGVAVDLGSTWLLHAGDAYFFRGEMDPERPHCTPGLRFYQWMMEQDRVARLNNQRRLRELARSHADRVRLFCAHDVVELESFARLADTPEQSVRDLRRDTGRVARRRTRTRHAAA